MSCCAGKDVVHHNQSEENRCRSHSGHTDCRGYQLACQYLAYIKTSDYLFYHVPHGSTGDRSDHQLGSAA